MTVVLDANVVVALVVTDDRQDAVRERLAGWLDDGEELHCPAVLPFEVANVLARRVFDAQLQMGDVAAIWADIADLGLVCHPFDLVHDGPDVAAVTVALRRRHATDSTYVCLARRLRTELWTLDAALVRNATSNGLPVRLMA